MILFMFKIRKKLFIYLLLIIQSFIIINSSNNITILKIGLQNHKIILSENQTIYEIKTNYLHLKLILNNFENIKESQIVDKIISDSPSVEKCAYASNFCQRK